MASLLLQGLVASDLVFKGNLGVGLFGSEPYSCLTVPSFNFCNHLTPETILIPLGPYATEVEVLEADVAGVRYGIEASGAHLSSILDHVPLVPVV